MRKGCGLLLAALLTTDAQANGSRFADGLGTAAIERTQYAVRYDGSYRPIGYPMGDVPGDIGVCTDLVIRAYRGIGIDLQRLVHEDMAEAFSTYPRNWRLSRPDPNIDHRRVPNLQRFFERQGEVLPITADGADYRPGDLVTWMLPGNLPHIGLVAGPSGGGNPLIVHNIGAGPKLEDRLFEFPITGHYRFPASGSQPPSSGVDGAR